MGPVADVRGNPVQGRIGLVAREIAHTVNLDGVGCEFYLYVIFLRRNCIAVEKAVLQAEIVGTEKEGGRCAPGEAEIRFDVKEGLRGGIQRKLLGTNPLRTFPGALLRAQKTGFEAGTLLKDGAGIVPDGKFHAITHVGLQGHSGIADALGAPVFHPSAVP